MKDIAILFLFISLISLDLTNDKYKRFLDDTLRIKKLDSKNQPVRSGGWKRRVNTGNDNEEREENEDSPIPISDDLDLSDSTDLTYLSTQPSSPTGSSDLSDLSDLTYPSTQPSSPPDSSDVSDLTYPLVLSDSKYLSDLSDSLSTPYIKFISNSIMSTTEITEYSSEIKDSNIFSTEPSINSVKNSGILSTEYETEIESSSTNIPIETVTSTNRDSYDIEFTQEKYTINSEHKFNKF